MKKLLLLAGIITVLVVGAFAFVIPAPEPPLLDANRRPLAESPLQGYCSGVKMMNGVAVEACYEDNAETQQTDRDLSQVIDAFCNGLIDSGWSGTYGQCREIMDDNQYWALLAGGITQAWSTRYPYPLDRFAENIKPDLSRTGEREDDKR